MDSIYLRRRNADLRKYRMLKTINIAIKILRICLFLVPERIPWTRGGDPYDSFSTTSVSVYGGGEGKP